MAAAGPAAAGPGERQLYQSTAEMLLSSSTKDEGGSDDDVTAMGMLTLMERFPCAGHVLSKHFYILALALNNTFME